MDAVVAYFSEGLFTREPDLVVKGAPDRPVFSRPVPGKAAREGHLYKFVVGPLWTTFYRLDGDRICDQDSVKTADIDAVSVAVIGLLSRPVSA